MVSESTAVLLIGITGSGKTHLAQALSARGVVRLSVDEEVHRLHGRYGVDYPEHEYFEREAPAVETVRAQLMELLRAGRSIVLASTTASGVVPIATSGRRPSGPWEDAHCSSTCQRPRRSSCGASRHATSVETPMP
jgi:hypothetical protein